MPGGVTATAVKSSMQGLLTQAFWTLKMEESSSSKMSVAINHSSQHHIPEDSNLHQQCCEKLESCIVVKFLDVI
jgi:hypothetical protein